jgi:rRNA-processing protein FCF1
MPEDKRQDIFISDSVYPDGEGIFNFSPKSLSELKKDSLIVLDTNTLLLPYSIGPNSIREIKQTYQKLVRQKRLFIPGQVAREFAKNRTNKISELFQQFNRKKAPKYPNQGRYPLLDEIEEYQDLLKLEQEIFALEKKYSQAVGKVLERIRGWGWNDPVSLIYHDLFYQGVVYEPEINREEITKDLERRRVHILQMNYQRMTACISDGALRIKHTCRSYIARIGRLRLIRVSRVGGICHNRRRWKVNESVPVWKYEDYSAPAASAASSASIDTAIACGCRKMCFEP